MRRPADQDPLAAELAAIVAGTRAELARLRDLARSHRRRSLLLLALEREQVVDIVYSEQRIDELITTLDADGDVIRVVRRAVLWVHRDEALHAQFIRGLLLGERRADRHGIVALASIASAQLVGAVGGWCSTLSRRGDDDHLRLRSLVARGAMGAGTLIGRVPPGLASAASRPDFESFCRLSAVLEQAAIEAYDEVVPLIDDHRETFDRLISDEHRHLAVFELFAAAFESSGLRDGWDANELASRLAEISPWFVGRADRPAQGGDPLGSGAPVVAIDATQSPAADLDAAVEEAVAQAGLDSLPLDGASVAIRTSFMLGYDRADRSNIVSPSMLGAVAAACRSRGAVDVAVVEAPTVYDRFFANRSVDSVARYFGFDDERYRIVDSSIEQRSVEFGRGLATTSASSTWLDADVRIVVARPAGDPAEVAHGALATMPGVTGRIDAQVYTSRLIDHRTAALMLCDVAPPDLALLDCWGAVADGPLGVMGCRKPSVHRRVYAGRDAIAVDAAMLGDLGAPASASEFIRRADQWFGMPASDLPSGSSAGPLLGYRVQQSSWWFRLISATAVPIYTHLSGNGRWFVPAMDTRAFPPTDRPGPIVRMIRRSAQVAFGLEPPRRSPAGPAASEKSTRDAA